MEISYSSINDLPVIFELFDHAIEYQKKNGYPLWPRFSQTLIETEIKEKRHYKITENGKIACVFSVVYNDPVIWGDMDKEPSVYLHRIAVNPEFKGKRMAIIIKHWGINHAREMNKKYLRMDTWGNNENMRNYYIKCGFNYIGQQQITNTENTPEFYCGNLVSLFQNEV